MKGDLRRHKIFNCALNALKIRRNHKYNTTQVQDDDNNNSNSNSNDKNIYMVVPYTKGLGVQLKNIWGEMEIQVYFK